MQNAIAHHQANNAQPVSNSSPSPSQLLQFLFIPVGWDPRQPDLEASNPSPMGGRLERDDL